MDVLEELAAATEELMSDVTGLTDEDVVRRSLLPGWTRGHVVTHLARNAEGGTRLLTWARTGVASYEYESVAARAEAIEQGATRPAAELVEDLAAAVAAFDTTARAMPPAAWQNPVTWTTGQQTPAAAVVESRLSEVLIHHVDLDLGYGPGSWPETFVRARLDRLVRSLNARDLAPQPLRLQAHDSGRTYLLGRPRATDRTVAGHEAALLAWLLGRSDGADLVDDGDGPLPAVPSSYLT